MMHRFLWFQMTHSFVLVVNSPSLWKVNPCILIYFHTGPNDPPDPDLMSPLCESFCCCLPSRWIRGNRHHETLSKQVPYHSFSWFQIKHAASDYSRKANYPQCIMGKVDIQSPHSVVFAGKIYAARRDCYLIYFNSFLSFNECLMTKNLLKSIDLWRFSGILVLQPMV